MTRFKGFLFALLAALLVSACGGSDSGADDPVVTPPAAVAPTIGTAPVAGTVSSGDAVTLSVTATGDGVLSYQWQRNGADIPGAVQATYTLGSATLADDGASFTVRVSNAAGSVSSAAAVLAVNAAGTVTVQSGTFVASALSATTVGAAGATLSVTDAADPLFGARITVPAGAVSQPVTVNLTSAPVTSLAGLPAGAAPRSRLVRVDILQASDGAAVADLRNAVSLTLPYDATSGDAVGFYKIDTDGVLEPMGTDASGSSPSTLSFRTRSPGLAAADVARPLSTWSVRPDARAQGVGSTLTYAAYVAVGLTQNTLAQLTTAGSRIDTGFKPSVNGFFIPNYGSYYRDSRGGNCFGMVGFAKYYYQQGFSTKLASNYRDAAPTATWVDDAVAIELASRVHNAMADIWSQYVSEELALQTSARSVAQSLIGALYITKRPALVYLAQVVGSNSSGAHAVAVYRADLQTDGSAVFHTYDPNFPSDDSRRIGWVPASGFQTYLSGTTAGDSGFSYNYFRHMGFYVGMTPSQLARAKQEADQGYPSSLFPRITITSIRGQALADNALANSYTTAQGQTAYRTTDRAVVIEGTVLGGNAQVAGQLVTNLNLIAPSGKVTASIDNQAGAGTGRFSVVVPLKAGVNQLALMASEPNSVSNWAAFKEVLVESGATASGFTVTMTWERDNTDVDLYVKEPDGEPGSAQAGKVGDIVYYSNRAGSSTTSAYLDFDNTSGFGPEHYIVRQGLVTRYTDGTSAPGAQGNFGVRVHYFSSRGSSTSVPWTVTWRVLTACRNGCTDPEVDGVWTTGSRTGILSVANSSADGPSGFVAGGASWSDAWQINVPVPLTTWTVPPSNTIMLP